VGKESRGACQGKRQEEQKKRPTFKVVADRSTVRLPNVAWETLMLVKQYVQVRSLDAGPRCGTILLGNLGEVDQD